MADDHLHMASNDAFADDVATGLSQPQKTIPCRWLYDRAGSELFEAITQTPEYYPTRAEQTILDTHAGEMATMIGPNAHIIEFGAGSSLKTRTLLSALEQPSTYWPIDISRDFLTESAQKLATLFPTLAVTPIVADFMKATPDISFDDDTGRKVGYFPGSTVSNLADDEIIQLLTGARRSLGENALFLLGVDLIKPVDILIPAYNDAAGITAAFNLNILKRINRELAGTFNIGGYTHEARWNTEQSQIEMHIVSRTDQDIRVCGRQFSLKKGETIHTENSRKFHVEDITRLAGDCGWRFKKAWFDPGHLFSNILLDAT